MNTDLIWSTESTSAEHTEFLGAAIGAKLRGGEVIELVSDLGGGKTTLTRGLVRGAGSSDRVASPTFTISKQYTAPKFTIAHYDFYRLHEAGIVAEELRETVGDAHFVTIVEWGDVVQDVLPDDRVTIGLAQTAEGSRVIRVHYPESLKYLMEEIAT